MISKAQISFIKSLHLKKYRREHGLFVVEGLKSITDFLLSGYVVDAIYYTGNLAPNLGKLSNKLQLININSSELARISTLNTPQGELAIVKIPRNTPLTNESLKGSFSLILDYVQDPGNMGTIIRTADWFGFKRIICSPDSVEIYNPKVVQASMGSLSRIEVHYADLAPMIKASGLPVFGAMLRGQSIYETKFPEEGLLILGNEGSGISQEISMLITTPITIPRFGSAESLNVAVSASIICSEIRRNS